MSYNVNVNVGGSSARRVKRGRASYPIVHAYLDFGGEWVYENFSVGRERSSQLTGRIMRVNLTYATGSCVYCKVSKSFEQFLSEIPGETPLDKKVIIISNNAFQFATNEFYKLKSSQEHYAANADNPVYLTLDNRIPSGIVLLEEVEKWLSGYDQERQAELDSLAAIQKKSEDLATLRQEGKEKGIKLAKKLLNDTKEFSSVERTAWFEGLISIIAESGGVRTRTF